MRHFAQLRVNDRVRIVDPKHPDFDAKGKVTSMTVVHVFVVMDDTTPLMLRLHQVQSLEEKR